MASQRIGILGGTFDPVHIGHLRVAEEAVEALELDCLCFIPASLPPHKTNRKILAFEHRWRMLELATEGNPRFELSDLERRLPGKSYTVLTLSRLREEVAGPVEFFFLVGLDAFLEVDTWWRFLELFRLAHLVVLRRPGYLRDSLGGFLCERVSPGYALDPATGCYRHPELLSVHYLENTHIEISSTRIRQLAAEGRSIRYLVLPEVMRYIEDKKFYGNWALPVS